MDITIRYLEIFISVVKYKSIKKASEKLFLSQSAVSMAITELEKKLGVKLFDRVGKKLLLNNNGEKLFIASSYIIEKIYEIEKLFIDDELTGKIIIGGTQTIGNYVLPKLIVGFKNNYKNVDVQLVIDNTERIINKLLNFEIDIAFIEGIVNNRNFEVIPWKKDEIVAFASKNDNISLNGEVSLKDLEKVKWILREKGSGTREIFEKTLYSKVKSLNIFLEINQIPAIKTLVEAGAGWGALSNLAIQDDLKYNRFKIIKLPVKIERELKIVIHKKKYKTLILKKFLEYAKCF